jgi:N-acetylneuraminic acid mutarotase
MSTPRNGQTATLLTSGQVLVVGGHDENGNILTSAELYAPGTDSWSPAGSMRVLRTDQTATLLPSGKVLVVGGGGTSVSALASAELYDPARNSWSPAASMRTAREGHTATLLPSGQVLVAGGVSADDVLAGAELYNPATNSWSSAGQMSTPRYGHTATLLPSGKVLVAGGAGYPAWSFASLASAELYNPATNSWSSAGQMSVPRTDQTATLLPSGKVLVVGGGDPGADDPDSCSAELYDPAGNAWSLAGIGRAVDSSMTCCYQTATLLPSGQVLEAGGEDWLSMDPLASAQLYDPTSNTWFPAASMSAGRAGHTATLLASGRVLVVGGFDDNGNALASAELYTP